MIKKFDKSQGWDKINSTYWWKIYLDPNHNMNNGNKILTGYSKRWGQSENMNKTELLMKIILRLNSKGYLIRSLKIEFYKREFHYIDSSLDKMILTLFTNDYDITDNVTDRKELIIFLDKFYNVIRDHKEIAHILPPRKKFEYSIDDKIDVHKVKIYHKGELISYCERLLSEGIPRKLVEHFYLKYLQLNKI